MVKKYQDPKEAEKLLKLESTLTEITKIVHKNLDDVYFSSNKALAAFSKFQLSELYIKNGENKNWYKGPASSTNLPGGGLPRDDRFY